MTFWHRPVFPSLRLGGLSYPLALAMLLPSLARADVLFIDLNFSYKEIAAAQAAAKSRGEGLVVVPNLSDADRQALNKQAYVVNNLGDKIGSLENRVRAAQGASSENSSVQQARVRSLQTQLIAMQAARKPKPAAYDVLRHEKLGKDLDASLAAGITQALVEADRARTTFSTVVLSGHNDGGQYFGEAGGIRDALLFNMLTEHASSKHIKSFYGWGCYTDTQESLNMVLESFPDIRLVAGFEGRSPSEEKAGDEAYLRYVMTRESQASTVTSPAGLVDFIKPIVGINELSGKVYVNNGKGGAFFGNEHSAIAYSQRNTDCTPAALSSAVSKLADYQKYLDCSALGYENPPADTDNGKLRQLYNLLREYAHCASFQSLIKSGLDPNLVLTLVLFNNVRANFAVYYSSSWNDFVAAWRKVGGELPPDFGDERTSRKQILDFQASLKKALVGPTATGALSSKELALLKAMVDRIGALLVNFRCTPSKWVEPPTGESASPDPKCVS